VNFEARSESSVVSPTITSTWPVISPEEPEHVLSVMPAPLGTNMNDLCSGDWAMSCPHAVWLTLDLNRPSWLDYHKFTLRVSWAAFNPADFYLNVYSSLELHAYLQRHNPSLVHDHHLEKMSSTTRRMFARIALIDAGVRTPPTNVTSPDTVPFIVLVEPLYFGVLPKSVVPILLFLVPVVGVAWFVVVPFVHGYLSQQARQIREELRLGRQKTE